ncbi:LysR family transcriptional regulator [Pseudomonas sp. PB120]|uniref:LysR family transcriptional regulator n=1 Tax=Pseudomonas sp. PB120 TaxID=2494700 RepID=UPI0012FE7415|nr:LysR substrate-binding domain-containing protein [Pseudomonas sp. PB120]MVV48826.1 LysR family transcriptional regulator [Pseudomonas sp. PB120]
MKLHQLRALLAICESGSIQEASRILHISQPSLSRSIKDLESELGVHLLVRSNRGITLTVYGEHLLSRARLILAEVRRAKDEIETLKGRTSGHITIGVSPVTPSSQFVNCLARFSARHPKVSIQIEELRPNKLIEGLREGRLDLVLTSHGGVRQLEGFRAVELYLQPGALAVRKGHPQRHLNSLAELRELMWILPDTFEDSPVSKLFSDCGLAPPENVMVCSSLVMYLELALRTDSVSFWSMRHMTLSNLSERLDVLEVSEQVPGFVFSLISREAELLTQAANILAEDILYEFQGNPCANPL